jgi:hypothetical protein
MSEQVCGRTLLMHLISISCLLRARSSSLRKKSSTKGRIDRRSLKKKIESLRLKEKREEEHERIHLRKHRKLGVAEK